MRLARTRARAKADGALTGVATTLTGGAFGSFGTSARLYGSIFAIELDQGGLKVALERCVTLHVGSVQPQEIAQRDVDE